MNRNDIIKRKFSHSFFGYDVEDVDLFLDEVIRELDRIHNELDIEQLKAEAARQREEKLRGRMTALERLLRDAGMEADIEALLAEEAPDEPEDTLPDPEELDEPLPDPEELDGMLPHPAAEGDGAEGGAEG